MAQTEDTRRRDSLELVRQSSREQPALDLVLTGAILQAIAHRTAGFTVRIFQPGPTVAFGRLDKLCPGFDAAWSVAEAYGYAPVLRLGGGHAAVYDMGSVIIEVLRPEDHIVGSLETRFTQLAELICASLQRVGVRLEVGELSGEYCPGRFSLHLPQGPKVAGIAQRIIRGASLTTAVLTVEATDAFRSLTAEIYQRLGLTLDVSTIGAITDRFPQLDVGTVVETIAERAVVYY